MPDYLKTIIEAGTKSATTTSSGTKMPSTTGKGEIPSNDIMKYLADRLQKQGEGISTSSSSDLQKEIEKAMQGTLAAGEASKQRILSERDREVGFAQDRGYATLVGAQESQTGYARQVAALHELNSTTEKSVRDLEGRYQEALLANDANTMSQYSGLIMKKLEFQQEQEQNFFSNVMSVANLQQSAIDSMMRREEFWAGQEQQENQFIASMSNSAYQFEQNMGLQYKELGLKEQELQIAWDRNAISRQELNMKKGEIEREKTNTTLQAIVYDKMKRAVLSGVDLNSKGSMEWVQEMVSELGPSFPMLAEMRPEEVATFIETARREVEAGVTSGSIVPLKSSTGKGTLGNVSTLSDAWNYIWSGNKTGNKTSTLYQNASSRNEVIQSPESYWGNKWH